MPFAALTHRPLALLYGGAAATSLALELFKRTALWMAVAISPAASASLATVQGVTMLAALLLGAGLRVPARPLMVASLGVMSLCAAALATAPPVPVLLGVVMLAAVALAQFEPTVLGALPRLARTERELLQINALIDGTHRIARFAGPGFASLALLALPLAMLAPVTAALIALAIPPILAVRGLAAPATTAGRAARPSLQPLILTARRIAADPDLALNTLVSIMANLVWVGGMLLGWAWLLDARLGTAAAAAAYGGLVATYSVSNIAANLYAGSRRAPPGRLVALAGHGLFIAGVAAVSAAAALDAPLWVWGVCALCAGAGAPWFDLRFAMLLQTRLPADQVGHGFRLRFCIPWLAFLIVPFPAAALQALHGPAAVGLAAGAAGLTVIALAIAFVLSRPASRSTCVQTDSSERR